MPGDRRVEQPGDLPQCLGSPAAREPLGCFCGMVGDNDVGARPFESGQGFWDDLLAIDPPLFRGRLDYRSFTVDLVHCGRMLEHLTHATYIR